MKSVSRLIGFIWAWRTDIILHNLRVVSIKEWRGKPSQVKLHVSLRSLDVPLVGDVHGFPPVNCKWDPNQACTHTASSLSSNFISTSITKYTQMKLLSLFSPFCLFRHFMSYVCQTLACACFKDSLKKGHQFRHSTKIDAVFNSYHNKENRQRSRHLCSNKSVSDEGQVFSRAEICPSDFL